MTYNGTTHIQKRAAMVGRRKKPIRLRNPSACISSGCIPSLVPGEAGKSHWFAGVLQREMLVILTADPNNLGIDGEADPIEWSDGRYWHTFRPQYTVLRQGVSPSVVEVQWAAKVVKFGLLEVLEFIQPFVRTAGYEGIELWTDSQIRDPVRFANATLLRSVASEKFDTKLLEHIRRDAHRAGGPISIGHLKNGMAGERSAFRAVAHLIRHGELVPSDSRRLIDDALTVTAISIMNQKGNLK